MKKFGLILLLFIAGCSWLDAPRGERTMTGNFIYSDFDPSYFGEKESSITYLFKTGNKSFLGSVSMKSLVKAFYDNKKSIPYQGEFQANITYDAYGRLDQFQLQNLDGQKINLNIKARDQN
jgi:hypothetical protein